MFENSSLITHIAIGKAVGLFFGFIALPYLCSDTSWFLRWGILLWHTTLGAIIGLIIGYFATQFGSEGREIVEK